MTIASCCLVFQSAYADADFEEWKKQQQFTVQQSKDEFESYSAEIRNAFTKYKEKTAAVWGRDNVTLDRKRWISYIDQLNQRSVVDFENGTIDVEIAMPTGQGIDEETGQQQLENILIKAMNLGDDRRSIEKFAEQPISQPEGGAVLHGQISLPDGDVAEPGDYRNIARNAASGASKRTLRGEDGKTRIVYTAQLKLVPDHIRIRARKYQPLVNQYSETHRVPVQLVFAVIETESMFNPTARSAAPAFGLMQLVPTSGARDAYKYLYKKDRVVSDTYLYDPENNIRLGSAYLYRLNSEYLGGIKSDESRMLATIAAYNTGASNVFRAFIGKYNRARFGSYKNYKNAALREINRRSPDQVYQHLRRHLPYSETREYIKKVTERMNKYTSS